MLENRRRREEGKEKLTKTLQNGESAQNAENILPPIQSQNKNLNSNPDFKKEESNVPTSVAPNSQKNFVPGSKNKPPKFASPEEELAYLEDAIGHEKNIVAILDDTLKKIEDENLIDFLNTEIEIHKETKEKLLNLLEVKANE